MNTSMRFTITSLAFLLIVNVSFAFQKDKPKKSIPTKAEVYITAKDTELKLSKAKDLAFKTYVQPIETEVSVFVDPTKTFQTFLGIGAALTDASAEVYAKLPAIKQQEFMQAYFSRDKGIGYTLARTNIASCDFSSGSYNYVAENDIALKTFSLEHDEQFRIPFIKQAIAAAGGKLRLYASPWSPPAWMKTNNNVLKGGRLLPQFKQTWADYFVKFIKAYEAKGISVWGLTVQNEPLAAQKWESCQYTAEEERDFIKLYLGPTLQKNGLGTKKIIAWDHNRDLIYQRAATILNDPEAAKYVWGMGFHWYETWTGGPMQFDNLKKVKDSFPAINLLFTEGCVERFNFDKMNDWALGERYGFSMLNDFSSGAVGWTDWNILLDENGGPNHVGNFCFAPVHANTKTGELIYTNSYYYMGQFSKFIQPGAKRIMASTSQNKISSVAFLNPNGKVVVVVLNLSDELVPYKVIIKNREVAIESLAHSIATIVI